jgi:hypothetical protein
MTRKATESVLPPVTALNLVRSEGLKEKRAVEKVQGMKPPDGKCRERDYISRSRK